MAAEAELRVLFDLNVILDVLGRREPYFASSAQTWAAVETGRVDGLVAAHSVTTLYYLLARHTTTPQAHAALVDLLRVFSIAAVDKDVIRDALSLGWDDFEDAVQMAAARHAQAAYLLTRNPADFQPGPLPVIQPAEFLALLSRG